MSALFVVSTPIGNLEDITYRAVRILGEVDLIAAEDTRHTRKLLAAYDIHTPTTSLHSHNESGKAASLLRRIEDGEDIALVSDGGTPGISDPGGRLIRAAIDLDIRVIPAPGPSACIAAASVAGLPTASFYYAGFCSPKSGRRRRRMESLRDLEVTLVFYESPHRVKRFLSDAEEVFGARPAVAARELTKVYEEFVRGSLTDLRAHFEETAPRGEFTILIHGRGDDEPSITADDSGGATGA
ncbi:16S rRNA (cytidine(1402)-2'-O)-methyltransferase [Candidatus Poribacteria bacterium]|jgi:16S rRNA (cytidine1402-2'-O)-methyltransferase|nr:16S rRNA (cytidine(1402)-2'-O)-methyltransferase [Candidatus Poribacteria bacterium]MBT5709831.1 16S rRNA (cytidine(1402)-2'-O)-methyltransferase [Candidatus Poribacteria bacterium]MBT7099047.1 16S rRNA (cytidine(1402)-2'-O)-methyltransferase [Candidatus Poribacteria bacterium]MBT7806028.1 16S rRNA (cytidine(1402)-2'-O)-methyltransferase [Candidatus Poribacteria bacterium]